jgi:hypothetical protein
MPALGLLLDVDGPIASPDSRTIGIDAITHDLIAIANAGNPVVFNTGRSDAFIREVVLDVLLAAGLAPDAPVHAVCEKGASWFSLENGAAGTVHVDETLTVPADYGRAIHDLVVTEYADTMFWDDTKLTMVSVEQRVEVAREVYGAAQKRFDLTAQAELDIRGLAETFRLDPSIISTDVEHRRVGKDLGASRALELVIAHGDAPDTWRTAGDSRGDYAMADWLHAEGYAVEHLDVRPADGVPEKPYPVLQHDELVHDHATEVFLRRWRESVV